MSHLSVNANFAENRQEDMKYLIVSDIHGSLPALDKVLRFYEKEQCDKLCILGDILNYGPRNGLPEGLDPQAIATRLNRMAGQIVAVRGNCDSEVDGMLLNFPISADYALIVDEGIRLFLTHGHIYNEKSTPQTGYDVLFYGHTHLWKLQATDRMQWICNTGSITFPKEGNLPTFAVYEQKVISIYSLDGSCLKTLDVRKH